MDARKRNAELRMLAKKALQDDGTRFPLKIHESGTFFVPPKAYQLFCFLIMANARVLYTRCVFIFTRNYTM